MLLPVIAGLRADFLTMKKHVFQCLLSSSSPMLARVLGIASRCVMCALLPYGFREAESEAKRNAII
jgi:hypothetical protein